MPYLSLVLPIYNVEKYIKKCLESITAQNFKNFEVLCIDDCGTDNSIKITQEFVQKDSRFKIIKHENNRGLSAARNTGIDNATGKYILFIDSDDWIENNLLEQIVIAFEQNKTDSVWFNSYIYNQKSGQTYFLTDNLKESTKIYLTPDNINNFASYAWNKAFKLSKLKSLNIKFPEGLYFEDSEFYLKIFSNISEIYLITQPLYHYQLRENSIVTSSDNVEKKLNDIFQITINLYKYFLSNNTFKQNKKIILRYFAQNILSVKINKQKKHVITLAKKVLKEIDFPNSYEDLNI